MRSLVLCPYLPDAPDHGGRIRSRVFIAGLAELGPVTVAAPSADRGDGDGVAWRAFAGELGLDYRELPSVEDRPSMVRKLASWSRGRSELFGRRWSPDAVEVVEGLIRGGSFDLLAVDSSHTLPILPATNVPLLVHYHNVESALLERGGEVRRPLAERVSRGMESKLVAGLEGRAASRARLSIVTSALDRGRLLELAPDARVEVVENSVDLPALPKLEPGPIDPPRILFVGSLGYPPNREAAEELLRMHLPVLRAEFPDLAIQIVGRDQDGGVAQLAAACDAEAVGRVDDLMPYYRGASATYIPMRSGGGTRIKVIEAFALGRPVLATRVAVEGLGVDPDEHYLLVETPTAGVEALRAVLSRKVGPMVDRARALVEGRWSHAAAQSRIARFVEQSFSSLSG